MEREHGMAVRALVLAGTYSWGDSLLDREIRGPLVPVAQVPLIRYALRWLHDGGVTEATLCTTGSSRRLRRYLGDGSALGTRIDYSEDETPRGAAGCLRDAGLRTSAASFLVVEGALIPTLDLPELLAAHRRSGAEMTVAVEQDRRHSELSGERLPVPGGTYVIERSVLEEIPASGFQDIKEGLIPRMYERGRRVLIHSVLGVSPRVLNAETYLDVNEWMVERSSAHPDLLEGYLARGRSMVHPGAWIDGSARLVGPVVVGPGVRIRGGATVVGPTAIGAGSVLDEGALVSRSVLWNHCTIGKTAFVDRCLLSTGTRIEASTRLLSAVTEPRPVPPDRRTRDQAARSPSPSVRLRPERIGSV
jgi:mannose-1-phosphate guanylyltransferase